SNVVIQLVNDLVYRGTVVFRAELFDPYPANGWGLADPTNATVTIRDDDPPTTTHSFTDVMPADPPPALGALTVTLDPTGADGRWHFPWETAWRLSDSTATNLSPDVYPVLFLDRGGQSPPAA